MLHSSGGNRFLDAFCVNKCKTYVPNVDVMDFVNVSKTLVFIYMYDTV